MTDAQNFSVIGKKTNCSGYMIQANKLGKSGQYKT
jgi:hypothetical protein